MNLLQNISNTRKLHHTPKKYEFSLRSNPVKTFDTTYDSRTIKLNKFFITTVIISTTLFITLLTADFDQSNDMTKLLLESIGTGQCDQVTSSNILTQYILNK